MRMGYKQFAKELVDKVVKIAKTENKMSGFCIGNTAKIDHNGLYFTPIRNMGIMIVAGVIVYSERQAMEITKIVDGKINYLLVDSEKKIPTKMSRSGRAANIERAIREVIKKSTLWTYKGNSLVVDAVDSLLTHLTKDSLRGIGGKKVVIFGAGNIGSKLALSLVERGACVFVARRDQEKLKIIVKALNFIRPLYTTSCITEIKDNEKAVQRADILIGVTNGVPVITSRMIRQLVPGALVVEIGKGSIHTAAIKTAEKLGIAIYRLDISAALEGAISKLFALETILKYRLGRKVCCGVPIVSGGLLGKKGEIVVDNINNPKEVYGMANGKGDFLKMPVKKYNKILKVVRECKEKDEFGTG
tara:strand:+ start:56 stop:1135 length:1080 start_codon:yes stop_codon:yes gene_type:complete